MQTIRIYSVEAGRFTAKFHNTRDAVAYHEEHYPEGKAFLWLR